MPSGPVVLVVDDDPDVRDVVTQTLEREGMTVVDASTGAEALRILAGDPTIDILLTDIMMPGITGITLAERAAALRPDLKIVFTSAYAAAGHPPGPLFANRFGSANSSPRSVRSPDTRCAQGPEPGRQVGNRTSERATAAASANEPTQRDC